MLIRTTNSVSAKRSQIQPGESGNDKPIVIRVNQAGSIILRDGAKTGDYRENGLYSGGWGRYSRRHFGP